MQKWLDALLAGPIGQLLARRLVVAVLSALIGALAAAGVLDTGALEALRLALSGL